MPPTSSRTIRLSTPSTTCGGEAREQGGGRQESEWAALGWPRPPPPARGSVLPVCSRQHARRSPEADSSPGTAPAPAAPASRPPAPAPGPASARRGRPHLALQRGRVGQLGQHHGGAQVGKGVQRGAQAQQALLGALRVGQGVPLVAAEWQQGAGWHSVDPPARQPPRSERQRAVQASTQQAPPAGPPPCAQHAAAHAAAPSTSARPPRQASSRARAFPSASTSKAAAMRRAPTETQHSPRAPADAGQQHGVRGLADLLGGGGVGVAGGVDGGAADGRLRVDKVLALRLARLGQHLCADTSSGAGDLRNRARGSVWNGGSGCECGAQPAVCSSCMQAGRMPPLQVPCRRRSSARRRAAAAGGRRLLRAAPSGKRP